MPSKRATQYQATAENPNWKGESVGYGSLHQWLNDNYPRSGVCEQCGQAARTSYSLIHGRSYSRDRGNYREQCYPCHNAYDGCLHRGPRNGAAKLTEDSVREIRSLLNQGETMTALGRRYGISRQAVGYLARRETWGWVV